MSAVDVDPARRGPGDLDGFNAGVHVARLPGKGRAVIAGRRFAKDELIERMPVIVTAPVDVELIDKTVLEPFAYAWGPERLGILLGYGMIYNHSYQPNAVYVRRMEADVIEYIAIRDIELGEEITINYGGRPDATDPVWFEVIE